VKKVLIFILGILVGIGISFCGYIYLNGKKYATLNQDYELSNGGILKKGTKIKYNGSFPEGFEQYTLYLNMPIWTDNDISNEKEKFSVIPYWIEPFKETGSTKINCDSIFEFGEEMPKFIGGDSELLKYNMEKIAPIIGESNKRTGNLISKLNYSLTISKEGEILESEILSKVDEQLQDDLKNELNKMPNWIAGKVNGKNECMKIRIPISCIKWE